MTDDKTKFIQSKMLGIEINLLVYYVAETSLKIITPCVDFNVVDTVNNIITVLDNLNADAVDIISSSDKIKLESLETDLDKIKTIHKKVLEIIGQYREIVLLCCYDLQNELTCYINVFNINIDDPDFSFLTTVRERVLRDPCAPIPHWLKHSEPTVTRDTMNDPVKSFLEYHDAILKIKNYITENMLLPKCQAAYAEVLANDLNVNNSRPIKDNIIVLNSKNKGRV